VSRGCVHITRLPTQVHPRRDAVDFRRTRFERRGAVKEAGRTAAKHPAVTTVEGVVIRTESGFHRILVEGRVVVARSPKRLLLGERTATTAVVIGDRVRVRLRDDDTGLIEEVLPRENELIRGAAGGSRYLDVIAANLDLLVAVHSLQEPEINPARLDRFLLIAEAAEIPAAVVLNKLDLATSAEIESARRIYDTTGYPVILTSALLEKGIIDLRDMVTGKLSAFVGPSGVGKSTLLNRIQPDLQLRTAEISESTGKGRHTTTTAELLALRGGGWVADTPGLRELAIRDVAPQELEWLFPEFRSSLGQCRFSKNCTHREEIGCAILAALERGEIVPERYRSYRRVYDQLLEEQAY
jgi:ribosome biogenesis GTPase